MCYALIKTVCDTSLLYNCNLKQKQLTTCTNFEHKQGFSQNLSFAIWSVILPLHVSVCPVAYRDIAKTLVGAIILCTVSHFWYKIAMTAGNTFTTSNFYQQTMGLSVFVI